jgi:NAD-dependent dihydropyrimidine dehydrogenase PreA subunit
LEETHDYKNYLGIPRNFIPWYPSVDQNLCTGCGLCVEHCKHAVYKPDPDANTVVVVNPYHCEVYCESCRFRCESGAISFPKKDDVKEVFKRLRKQYPPKA